MTPWHLDIPSNERPYCDENVLFFYDGPQLFWMPCEGRRLLSVALPDEVGHWPFLVVELTEEQARGVEDNRITLRAAVLAASARWVLYSYDAPTLELNPLDTIPEDWLPGDVFLRPVPSGTDSSSA